MGEVGGERSSELLNEVQRAAAAIDEAHRQLIESVARTRDAGISYAAIGKALGVSRQAAWERFNQAAGDRPTE